MAELATREQADKAQEEEDQFQTPRQAFEQSQLCSTLHGSTRVQSRWWKALLTSSVTDIVTIIIVTVAIPLDHLRRCATVTP